MRLYELTENIINHSREKSEKQVENLKEVRKIAAEFHKYHRTNTIHIKNKIEMLKDPQDILVLEVAHQPTFLPYYGIWKKILLANQLAKNLNYKGYRAVALFGLFDNDTSMNDFLYSNQLPYYSKDGYKKIGFKIKGKNKWWQLWCQQPLPSKDNVEEFIELINSIYRENGLSSDDEDLLLLKKLLKECYTDNYSFAGANARFFSKVCNEIFGMDIIFFNYSEVQKSRILTKEYEKILMNRRDYIKYHNEIIRSKNLNERLLPENHIPFWYHCSCGGKCRIKIKEKNKNMVTAYGYCKICNNSIEINFEIDNLDINIDSISFDAISRELIIPNALGSVVYVEGLGGSLSFRQISKYIAEKLGFKTPFAINWPSYDRYVSIMLERALKNYKEDYATVKNSIEKLQEINGKILEIDETREKLKSKLKSLQTNSDEFNKTLKQLKDVDGKRKKIMSDYMKHHSVVSNVKILSKMYSTTPSILDELLSVGFNNLLECWLDDLKKNDIEVEHENYLSTKNRNGDHKNLQEILRIADEYKSFLNEI